VAVALDVEGGDAKEIRVIAKETEALIAPLAEQLSDAAARMIVIKVLRLSVATDGTAVILGCTQLGYVSLGEAIRPLPVRLAVSRLMARLAATAEAGRAATGSRVVVVGDILPAFGTPAKAFGDPGDGESVGPSPVTAKG
jgi:hypothetical protein